MPCLLFVHDKLITFGPKLATPVNDYVSLVRMMPHAMYSIVPNNIWTQVVNMPYLLLYMITLIRNSSFVIFY